MGSEEYLRKVRKILQSEGLNDFVIQWNSPTSFSSKHANRRLPKSGTPGVLLISSFGKSEEFRQGLTSDQDLKSEARRVIDSLKD